MLLGIYGSGGLGREVLELAKQINAVSLKWDEIVFIDDYSNETLKNGINLLPFSAIKSMYLPSRIEIVIAIGEPQNRKLVYDEVAQAGCKFATLVHPSVFVPDTTNIGAGCIIGSLCFISCDVSIGSNSYIMPLSSVGHDCALGNHVCVSSKASFGGACQILEGAYIGLGATIKEQIKVGSWSIVGMGSVVYQDIPDSMIALGNPARISRKNEGKKVFK